MDEAAGDGLAIVQCLLQRVEHEAGVRRPRHAPADDAAGVGVDDERDVDEAGPRRDVGEVRDPQHVRPWCPEPAIDVIERTGRGLVAHRRAHPPAADHPLQSHFLHQPRHRAAGHVVPFPQQLPPDLAHAVDLEVLIENPFDLDAEHDVALDARRCRLRLGAAGDVGVVCRRGDRQHLADRLDPVVVAVRIDEADHGFHRRSSSAWAKYALALRRISLAWRSSRFSRSSALMRSRSSVVVPGPLALVALGLPHPVRQRLRRAADLGRDRGDRRPLRGVLARGAPTPSAPRAHAPRPRTSGMSCDSSWLQSLKSWSLRQTRGGSQRQFNSIACSAVAGRHRQANTQANRLHPSRPAQHRRLSWLRQWSTMRFPKIAAQLWPSSRLRSPSPLSSSAHRGTRLRDQPPCRWRLLM